ncbi:MAG: ATP-binding protein [Beijerinckiaceae bacterium]
MDLRRRFGSVPSGTQTTTHTRIRRALLLSSAIAIAPCAALANTIALTDIDRIASSHGTAGASLFAALAAITCAGALIHLASRRSWGLRERQLVHDLATARADLDRANAFLASEAQILVSWRHATGDPEIAGDLTLALDQPAPLRVLAFGSWLPASQAKDLEAGVEKLRARGEGFRMGLVTLAGRHLEAQGRAVAGRAVLRIRDVSGDRLELTQLRERHTRAMLEADALRAMLDALPSPVWMRDSTGALAWVNGAYAKAVEAADPRDAVARGIELLEKPTREAAAEARARGEVWRGRAAAIVAGQRHRLEITEAPSSSGAVGMAIDQTELEGARADLSRQMEAHARTLDQLSTAVAIFDGAKRLVFHNTAYRQLWSLDAGWLETGPSDSEILDKLRAERRLPEQADFRQWKGGLMEAYRSTETSEQTWFLPDRRTLRVVITPNNQGGVTYLFDDVTEGYRLQTQYRALVTVQGETLDTLREGVAVFGADGRLKLANVAFSHIWSLDHDEVKQKLHEAEAIRSRAPHVDEIAGACDPQCPGDELWDDLRSVIAGLHEARTGFTRRVRRGDERVLDCAAMPLPDGSTLVTFSDVTAAADFERALTERNQALLTAQKLREEFVHHVSYELRSPLTNIIGYIHLLGDEAVGKLNEKQREYADHILNSSDALLAIINDILDLATIDADALELDVSDVDVLETMQAAAEGVQDRLRELDITLNIVALDGAGRFRADAKRVRQVLFNLLSNAIGFSAPGQAVTLAAMRRGADVVFKVTDQGRGIPRDVLDSVFDRFRSHTVGTRHRGVGLGLSIVRSLVELHGGRVQIDSAPGEGTAVTCIFPDRADDALKPGREPAKNVS